MLDRLKSKAAHTARRAGLLTGGLLAVLVGFAFLTGAAWIYLVNITDAQTAALILGGAFTGIGLLTIGFASVSGPSAMAEGIPHDQRAATASALDQPPLMQAFLHGMQAGVSATQTRR